MKTMGGGRQGMNKNVPSSWRWLEACCCTQPIVLESQSVMVLVLVVVTWSGRGAEEEEKSF